MQIVVKAKKYNKPQINADERGFIYRVYLRLISHITLQSIEVMFFALWLVPQLRHRTRMARIGRILTDTCNPCVSVSSVKSVFYRNCSDTEFFHCTNRVLHTNINQIICVYLRSSAVNNLGAMK